MANAKDFDSPNDVWEHVTGLMNELTGLLIDFFPENKTVKLIAALLTTVLKELVEFMEGEPEPDPE